MCMHSHAACDAGTDAASLPCAHLFTTLSHQASETKHLDICIHMHPGHKYLKYPCITTYVLMTNIQ
jgi:hypothetical protein